MKKLINSLCEQKQIEHRFLLKSFVEDFFNTKQTPEDAKAWIERFDNHLKSSMQSAVGRYVDLLGSNSMLINSDLHEKIMQDLGLSNE